MVENRPQTAQIRATMALWTFQKKFFFWLYCLGRVALTDTGRSCQVPQLGPDTSLLVEGCLANFINNKALGQSGEPGRYCPQEFLDTDGIYVHINLNG